MSRIHKGYNSHNVKVGFDGYKVNNFQIGGFYNFGFGKDKVFTIKPKILLGFNSTFINQYDYDSFYFDDNYQTIISNYFYTEAITSYGLSGTIGSNFDFNINPRLF